MATPAQADLQAMFGMEPRSAVEYMRRKGFVITWNWQEADAALAARSFTVAKAARLDILETINNALIDNLRNGGSLQQFQERLTPALQSLGWWGQQVVVDSEGNAQRVQLGSPRRLATIYQTNMQSAYMAGRQAEMLKSVKTHPYWQYIAVMDGGTRPSHAALNGKVFRWDDPIWQHIFPPNGYNCRCRIRALSAAAVKRMGLQVESSIGNTRTKTVETGTDKRTGEIYTSKVTVLRTTNAAGQRVTFSPDPGFDGSPAQGHLMDDILVRKSQRTLGSNWRNEVKNVVDSPVRKRAWNAYVDNTLRMQTPQNQTMTLGVLAQQDIDWANNNTDNWQRAIAFVDDAALLNVGLSARMLKMLPERFNNPERVLWMPRSQALVYVLPGDGEKTALRVTNDASELITLTDNDINTGLLNGDYQRVR